jgi:transcriptional regulator with AAA-type ATPase domain
VTRRIEEKVAENVRVEKIEGNTRTGFTAVYMTLVEGTRDTGKEFDDIKLKLDSITDLPDGAGPIDFVKDFGEARDLFLQYDWPGNVRELRNTLERAAILCEGGLITGDHLTLTSAHSHEPPRTTHGRRTPVPEVESTDLRVLERTTIERALQDARHNKSQAAKMLGLSRKQLYVRLRQHGLD